MMAPEVAILAQIDFLSPGRSKTGRGGGGGGWRESKWSRVGPCEAWQLDQSCNDGTHTGTPSILHAYSFEIIYIKKKNPCDTSCTETVTEQHPGVPC